MCARSQTPPPFICTVGELTPGQWFHDPNGETWMVLGDQPRTNDSTMVINTGNGNGKLNPFGMSNDELKGKITPMYNSIRLGTDRDGRLYASTYLNDWYDYYTPEDEPVTLS